MTAPLAVAALVGIPLVQLPLVVFLSRYVELDGDEPRPPPGRGYVTYGTESARPGSREPALSCPHCGTLVADGYDYCGACVGRLPPRRARR
ncbi:zinc ribbon domain-containing protein [Haloplanus halophilus]|uniref:zinc ribbon domain-containing protein n=1 Tax=Haloplanus halophilus TaxID=2949993 RepID=UPI00203D76DC|nr:zinc ribbon domain-containing protein [Haloplanus sp. GDY1]